MSLRKISNARFSAFLSVVLAIALLGTSCSTKYKTKSFSSQTGTYAPDPEEDKEVRLIEKYEVNSMEELFTIKDVVLLHGSNDSILHQMTNIEVLDSSYVGVLVPVNSLSYDTVSITISAKEGTEIAYDPERVLHIYTNMSDQQEGSVQIYTSDIIKYKTHQFRTAGDRFAITMAVLGGAFILTMTIMAISIATSDSFF
jgi:hypothetical protein